jgi:hypothetical protein
MCHMCSLSVSLVSLFLFPSVSLSTALLCVSRSRKYVVGAWTGRGWMRPQWPKSDDDRKNGNTVPSSRARSFGGKRFGRPGFSDLHPRDHVHVRDERQRLDSYRRGRSNDSPPQPHDHGFVAGACSSCSTICLLQHVWRIRPLELQLCNPRRAQFVTCSAAAMPSREQALLSQTMSLRRDSCYNF